MSIITDFKEQVGNAIIEMIEGDIERCLLENGFNHKEENGFSFLYRCEFSKDHDTGIIELTLDGKTILAFGEVFLTKQSDKIIVECFIKK